MTTTLDSGEGVTAEAGPLTAGVAAVLLADEGLLGCAGLRMAADSGGVVKAAEAGLAASTVLLLLLLGATTALMVRSALITSAPVVLPSLALLLQL